MMESHKLKLGVDYYPEQWPPERWSHDAAMMADLGFSLVRLGEFSWSLLEPTPERFDFDWLDRAITILSSHGLGVILGTPTPTPPPWLTMAVDVFQRDRFGHRRGPGSRRAVCANHPTFLSHTDRIVTALARHYGQNMHVIAWQIDNEFGDHDSTRCFCTYCQAAFQRWLAKRYGTLRELNERWGTVFWSAIYTEWEQIPVPAHTPARHNPGLELDFRRFSSETWVAFQKRQIDIIRQYTSAQKVTHNLMGMGQDAVDQIDYWALAEDLDFVSWDNYIQGKEGPDHVAFLHDMMRSFKHRSFWVMEQQPGVVNWDRYNRPAPPGQVRLWTYQAFAHGAEAVLYFRWRAARFGQEQYHMGVLKQDGSPTRLYDEARQVRAELAKLPPFSPCPAKVAIAFDYEDLWALQLDPHQADFSYFQWVMAFYRRLHQAGIAVDLVRRREDFSQYRTVILPTPILIDDEDVGRWHQYVENGGHLLVTFRAFAKEKSNVWSAEPLPGALADVLGVRVQEYIGLPPDVKGTVISPQDHRQYAYALWAEVLVPQSALPLLHYEDDNYWSGTVAATVQQHGAGKAITLGCWLDDPLVAPIWQEVGLEALQPDYTIPPELEAVPIQFADGRSGLILLNHDDRPQEVVFPRPVSELLSGQDTLEGVGVESLDIAIVRFA